MRGGKRKRWTRGQKEGGRGRRERRRGRATPREVPQGGREASGKVRAARAGQWEERAEAFRTSEIDVRGKKGWPVQILQHNMNGVDTDMIKAAQMWQAAQADVVVLPEAKVSGAFRFSKEITQKWEMFITAGRRTGAGRWKHGVVVLVRRHRGMWATQVKTATIKGVGIMVKIDSMIEEWKGPLYVEGLYASPTNRAALM